jgi:hypothetical protein
MRPDATNVNENVAVGIAIGAAMGAGLFAATRNAVFIGAGVAGGIALGLAMGERCEGLPVRARRSMVIASGAAIAVVIALVVAYFVVR